MDLTLDPLVRTTFVPLRRVLTIPLIVLVVWGMAFLCQQESSINVIFFVCHVCTNKSRVQRRLTHRNILALKFLIFFPNLKIGFIVIVVV